jgi:DNA-binding transcriptional regulator YhcF (GntR family)
MSKRNRTGRGGKTARHIRLYHYMTDSAAWHDLSAVARAIYCEIAKRYAGDGSNNGRIPYSIRQAAAELRIGPATASRGLRELQTHGFIVSVTKGAFSLKKRHATEWRLTEFPCDLTRAIASKDFMRWQPGNLERGIRSETDSACGETDRYLS